MKNIFLKTAILGVLTALVAAIAQQFTSVVFEIASGRQTDLSFQTAWGLSLVIAVVIEELLKFSAIRLILSNFFGMQGKKLVWSGFTLGFTYGLTEIFLIFYSDPETLRLAWNFESGVIFSLFSILAIQAITATFMASVAAPPGSSRYSIFFRATSFPIFIHLLFNFLVIQQGTYTPFLLGLILAISFVATVSVAFSNHHMSGE